MRRSLLMFLLVVVLFGGVHIWRKNVPDSSHSNNASAYVGSQSCVVCHEEISTQYQSHPMANSFTPVLGTEQKHLAEPVRFPISKEHGPVVLEAKFAGAKWVHSATWLDGQGEPINELKHEAAIDYVVGSGHLGQSFLSEDDGYFFQSPISYYSKKQRWDLSPGFVTLDPSRLFERPIVQDCLFCHAGRIQPVSNTINRFEVPPLEASIGCERCHGPGSGHVAFHSDGSPPSNMLDPIVNPAKLPPVLRDNVCEQCHLKGEARVPRLGHSPSDYQPGQPLEEYLRIFVSQSSENRPQGSVGHVEQMRASVCFQKSDNAMSCTSCHDPHRRPDAEQATGIYRERCLSCHDSKQVAHCPQVTDLASSDCVSCHMPKAATHDIPHTAETDHGIPRNASQEVAAENQALPRLVFYPDRQDVKDAHDARDLACAVAELWQVKGAVAYLRPTLTLTSQAVQNFPDDLLSRRHLAAALAASGDPRAAAIHYRQVAESLNDPLLAEQAAGVFLAQSQPAEADRIFENAVSPPRFSRTLSRHAQLHASSGRWQQAFDKASRAVTNNPLDWQARQILIHAAVLLGNKQTAVENLVLFERANRPETAFLQSLVQKSDTLP